MKPTMNGTSPELFSGWKEIAGYLGKGVRTVQRYERHMGLPVRRPAGKSQSSVLATRAELDAWVSARPFREALQFERRLPNQSAPAFASLKSGIAEMHRLQEEMSALRKELKASVASLQASLAVLSGASNEVLLNPAKQTITVQTPILASGDGSGLFYSSSADDSTVRS